MTDNRPSVNLDPAAFEAAMRAFHIGPPGVLCSVIRHDSCPPEYEPIPCNGNDEREDIARAIRGYLNAL